MPESQKIGLLHRAVNANKQLLQAWSAVETIIANGNSAGTPISYATYMDYLVQHSDMLDEGALNNTTLKANRAQSNYMESYDPQDLYFDDAADLSAYMGEQTDVDDLQHTLLCNQAMREGKPRPQRKLRGRRPAQQPELQIKGPLWSDISPELRSAWARETAVNKEKVIAQFKVPIVKNSQLTAYKSDTNVGYESDITENTHNSEHTYVFQAETEFDTIDSVNSNGELEDNHPTDVLVNKAASNSILRTKRTPTTRVLPKSSDMSSGAPAKMLANRQLRVMNEDGTTHSFMTLNARMAKIDYTRFDSLINSKSLISTPDVHYKVNLAQTI